MFTNFFNVKIKSKFFRYLACLLTLIATAVVLYFFVQGAKAVDPTIDTSTVYPNGTVYTVVEDDEYIYFGGDFSLMNDGETVRNNIARIVKSTGALDTTWNPNADDIVYALHIDGSDIYAGGSFSEIGGLSRSEFAKLNNTNGSANESCDPDVYTYIEPGTVYTITSDDTYIYIGGSFNRVSETVRNGIARINKSDCSLDSWNPNASGRVWSIAIDDSSIYVGGEFTNIGGASRNYVAKLNNTDGTADGTWNPNADELVRQVIINSNSIFVGGAFTTIGGGNHNWFAKLNNTDGSDEECTADFTQYEQPAPETVTALEIDGNYIYVGGDFNRVNGNENTRRSLARLNLSDCSLDDWTVNATDTYYVYSIVANGDDAWVGGNFTNIGDEENQYFAHIITDTNPPTLSLTPLSPDPTTNTTPSLTGSASDAKGTVSSVKYAIDSANSLKSHELVYQFLNAGNDGQYPYGSVIISGTKLYGMTNGDEGNNNYGTIYSVETDGTGFSLLHEFNFTQGGNPYGSLISSGSKLYGMTNGGGSNEYGIIFSIDTNGDNFAVLHEFSGTAEGGGYPYGSLILSGNTLYGFSSGDDDTNYGNIFSINTDGTNFTSLHQFDYTNGGIPTGSPLLSGSTLYGMTYQGGSNEYGTVFSINTDGSSYTVLHEFNGNDGGLPRGNLAISGNTLYGMTYGNDDDTYGNIFSIDTNGSGFTQLHEFYYNSGSYPYGSLTISNSKLYGVTNSGGDNNYGIIFSIDTAGENFSVLHSFANGVSDGAYPRYVTLAHENGILYGTTAQGGDENLGTIFTIGTGGTACSANDGAFDEQSEDFSCSITPALTDGEHTMYVQSTDSVGNITPFGSEASDTFTIDTASPTIFNILSPSGYILNANPVLSFRKSLDTSLSSYTVELDAGKNQSYLVSGIPASGNGTSQYTWLNNDIVEVKILNEGDGNLNNDEILVYFKELSSRALTEGAHTWSVSAIDTSGNTLNLGSDFYVDQSPGWFSQLAIDTGSTVLFVNEGSTYALASGASPSYSGLVFDPFVGSTKTNANGTTDTFEKVASGPKEVKLSLFKLEQNSSPYSKNPTYEHYSDIIKSVTDEKTTLDTKYASIYLTTQSLPNGYYKAILELTDNVGNSITFPTHYYAVNYHYAYSNDHAQVPEEIVEKLADKLPNTAKAPALSEDQQEEEKVEKEDQEQNIGYTVSIKIVDSDNNPVEGAKVELHSDPMIAYTNVLGIATFKGVEKGEHTIKVSYDGIYKEEKISLDGNINQIHNTTIGLESQNTFSKNNFIFYVTISLIIFILLVIGFWIYKKNHKK